MSSKVVSTTFLLNSGTGTQDITTSDLGGLTPKAAKFMMLANTVLGTTAPNEDYMVGATDGTNQWACAIWGADDVATSDCDRYATTNACICVLDAAGVDCQASFSAFITNGIRINITDAPAAQYYGLVQFFAGTDVSVDVGTFHPANNVNDSVSVTTGFAPDLVYLAGIDYSFTESRQQDASLSIGAGIPGGAQCCKTHYSEGGEANGKTYARQLNEYAYNNPLNAGLFGQYKIEITSSTSTTFVATTRENSATTSDDIGYLAVAINGALFHISQISAPTATGNKSYTGVGFRPQSVEMICGISPSYNETTSNSGRGSIVIAIFDGNVSNSFAMYNEGEAATINCGGRFETGYFQYWHTGTTLYDATFVSFDSDGWTLNFTTADSGTYVWSSIEIHLPEDYTNVDLVQGLL